MLRFWMMQDTRMRVEIYSAYKILDTKRGEEPLYNLLIIN